MWNKENKIIFALLFCFLILGFKEKTAYGQPQFKPEIRTTLIAGIDFVPEILEMIRQSLTRRINYPVSLAYQPLEKEFSESLRRRSEILLVVEGVATTSIPLDYEPTVHQIDLVWVLVIREQLGRIDGAMNNLESFGKALLELKTANLSGYPWFESLYSANTMMNFQKIFNEYEKEGVYKNEPFWSQPDLVKMLYRAMEQGLLNPLSVEADQDLATKVFLAGDSQCFTVWVPLEFLEQPRLVKESFGEAEIVVFPGKARAKVPRLVLRIWKTDETEIVWSERLVASTTMEFIDSDFTADRAWVKQRFGQIYDMLIMGDF